MTFFCLPFFITAIAAVVVFVTSEAPLDALSIVTVELAVRASLLTIFFVALVPAVVVPVAPVADAE